MPVSGQSPLTTITVAKEQEQSFQPLIVAELQFVDGAVLRLSSENLAAATGGVPYNGQDWLPRLNAQELQAISTVSNNGIVQSPTITLTISDADKTILNAWEWTNDRGFKGAKLTLFLIYADLPAATFSTDSRVLFVGVCDAPDFDAYSITVTATNLLNLSRRFYPVTRVGTNCPWIFPTNAAQRLDGMRNPDSPYFNCGYSPDMNDPRARGNFQSGTTPFTACTYDWNGCIDRMGDRALPASNADPVQIEQDQSGRHTGRYGGSHFYPPLAWRGVQYVSGTKNEGLNNPNEAKFNDYFPMLYGKNFVQPIVMNVLGDPNSTRFECVICVGQIHDDLTTPGPIQTVLVNGYVIPHASQSSDLLLRWYWITNGDRNGNVNHTEIYNGAGDPYGSEACILIVVPVEMQASNGIPNVSVLTTGVKIRVYTADDPTAFTRQISSNPSWHTLDLLTRAGWQPEALDLPFFIAAAHYCDVPISYTALDGTQGTHERFRAGFTYRQLRSASECLTNLLAGFRGILRSSVTDGRLQLLIKTTLADQQPNPMPGSNNQTPIGSTNAAGTAANGYLAYDFNESNIKLLPDGNGHKPAITFRQRKNADTANRIELTFQDENAGFVADSLTLVDPDDVGRIGSQVKGSVAIEGLVNYDQVDRILQSTLSENYRGNPRAASTLTADGFDTGGTLEATIISTSRVSDLRCGDLVRVGFTSYGIQPHLFRVTSIKPSKNYEDCEVKATFHKDNWYVDIAGQKDHIYNPGGGLPGRNTAPFGWCPNLLEPTPAEALYRPTEKTFSLSQTFTAGTNNSLAVSVNLGGFCPVNSFSPIGATVATTAAADTTSGTIPAGTYWLGIVGVDANGLETSLSWPPASASLTAPGKITVSGLAWPFGTVNWKLFAGTDPNRLSLQANGTGNPSTIQLSTFTLPGEGAPDSSFSYFSTTAQLIWHPGVWLAPAGAVTATTIQIPAAGWTANQWAGYIVSILGKATAGDALPVANFLVASNTADTLTIGPNGASPAPDLTALNVAVGDIVVMRAKASIASSTTIGDPSYVNSLPYFYPPLNIANLTGTSPIVVTTQIPHTFITGDKVQVSNTNITDGLWTITVISPFAFSLNGSTDSSGNSYVSGGQIQLVSYGLGPDSEIGRTVRILGGTGAGQTRRIVSNNPTTVTIDSPWTVIPDATSTWIILDSSIAATQASTPLTNSSPTTPITLTLNAGNSVGQAFFIQPYTASQNNQLSLQGDTPWREIYLVPPNPLGTSSYYNITFGIGIGAPLQVGTNVCPLYYVRTKATMLNISVGCKVWPTGSNLVIDILRTTTAQQIANPAGATAGTIGTTILGTTHLTVPAGTNTEFVMSDFATNPLDLSVGDLLTVNVLSTGGTQEVTIQCKVRVFG